MGRIVRLNYEELNAIVRLFRDQGEDVVKMQANLRDRVRDLHKDWEGEAADKFFHEMEGELLPAVSRLARALFFAQDTLQKIIKLIQDFDQDTVRLFKRDLLHISPAALGAAVAGFGVSQAVGGIGAALGTAARGDSGSSSGEAGGGPQEGSGQTGGQSPGASGEKAAGSQAAAGAGAGAGGGGGAGAGGGSSQGLQGNLGSMGGGVGAAVGGSGGGAAGGGSAAGGAQAPDHLYGDTSGGAAAAGLPRAHRVLPAVRLPRERRALALAAGLRLRERPAWLEALQSAVPARASGAAVPARKRNKRLSGNRVLK